MTGPNPSSPSPRDVRTFASGSPLCELQLVALAGHNEGRVIPMRQGTVIGRAPEMGASVDEEDVSRHHARLSVDEATSSWEIEDLTSRNGTWVNGLRITRAPLRPGDILRLGARATFKVTAHDPVEGELRERQRLELVGRISAGFIHDFNNMIAAALANVDYVRNLPAVERGASDAEAALEDTYVALQRAAELASRLLHAARPNQGEASALDVSKLCGEVASMLRRVIPLTIEIDLRIAPRLRVVGFASSLQQVLVNLCLNARDAMREGGTLAIQASTTPGPEGSSTDWVVLRVSDTGMGMDDETRKRIFEPFFTTKRGGRGFGLGLAMSADIVAHHGGRIEVESVLGQGTTFSIHLPAARRTAVTTAVTVPQARRDGTGIGVLVVDDQPAVRRGLRRILEQARFDVIEAPDGLSALSIVSASSSMPKVALIDFDMPGMNGIETCRALRAAVPGLRTILMSGGPIDAAEDDETYASRLQKPIETPTLLEAVTAGLFASVSAPAA
jgi:two-component system cell cycle sensor histidine kinase/response regulator CckA